MVRFSNAFLSILNVIIIGTGLTLAGTGLYFLFGGNNTSCAKNLANPLLIMGACLFFLSLLGLIGSCMRVNFLLIIYLMVMFLAILTIMVFGLFTLFITNEDAAKVAARTKIANFPNWLRNHFVNDQQWNEIKDCLTDAKVCKSLGGGDVDKQTMDFYMTHLSPIQSGCCLPPATCGFKFKNATFWVRPITGPVTTDSDCKTWSNHQETLCYNCDSCKNGFVNSIKKKWMQLGIFNLCLLFFILIVYSVGCCARRSNRKDNMYSGYRAYV